MSNRTATAILATTLLWGGVAVAQSLAPAGAVSCSGCHAPARLGGPVPGFAGHDSAEIVKAMQAFRSGERPATVMGRIAKGFSDDETKAIADWLAAHPE